MIALSYPWLEIECSPRPGATSTSPRCATRARRSSRTGQPTPLQQMRRRPSATLLQLAQRSRHADRETWRCASSPQRGGDQRPDPGDQPLRRQSRTDARSLSGLQSADRPDRRRRSRARDRALGMPSSQHAQMEATKKRAAKLEAKGKSVDFKELLRMEPDGGTTNIRSVKSKHWARWLGPAHRCVVPFNSFSELRSFSGMLSREMPLRLSPWCKHT